MTKETNPDLDELARVRRIESSFGINHHTGSGCCESHGAITLSDETLVEGWFTDIDKPDVREEAFQLTWGAYRRINEDSDELPEIKLALLKGKEFYGGGGAAASYLIRRVH